VAGLKEKFGAHNLNLINRILHKELSSANMQSFKGGARNARGPQRGQVNIDVIEQLIQAKLSKTEPSTVAGSY